MGEIKTPTATVEENYWANITRPKEKVKENKTDDNTTDENSSAEEKPEASTDDAEKTEKAEESSDATANASEAAGNDSNATNASEVEMETVQKLKKKKHEKKLEIKRHDSFPRPLSEAQVKEATER